jgi:aspartyl-tRNA(Asn)/glutamyl-tRNA(Gln) amidotransferase subunit C
VTVELRREDVERIATLAHLALEPEEVLRLTRQLADILAHFETLRALDLHAVSPFDVAAERCAPPREDVPGADVLHVAPAELSAAWRDGFFTVPRLAAQQDEAWTKAEET